MAAAADFRDEEWAQALTERLASEGSPLQVRRSATRGICVVASRDINQGEVLATDQPISCTVNEHAYDRICAGCLRGKPESGGGVGGSLLGQDINLKMCIGCSKVSFCDDISCCRGRAFHTESMECASLAALQSQRLPNEVADLSRMLVQLMARHADGHDLSAIRCNAMGKTGEFLASTDQERALVAAVAAVDVAKTKTSAACREVACTWNEDTVRAVMNVQQANVYSLAGTHGYAVLCMFSSVLHLFNHSCLPNMAVDSVPLALGSTSAQAAELRCHRPSAAGSRPEGDEQ